MTHAATDGTVPSTQRRLELKYLPTRAECETVLRRIEDCCHPVRYAGPTSLVHSLYFDDEVLSACRESVDGCGDRLKLRFRWYDHERPTTVFLEQKRRQGALVVKERLAVPARLVCEYGNGATSKALTALTDLPDSFRFALFRRPHPVVIVRYRRRYFRGLTAATRITVDDQLTIFDQFARCCPSLSFGIDQTMTIVEIKVPCGEEGIVAELVDYLGLRRQRCSKYVMACQAIGAFTRR